MNRVFYTVWSYKLNAWVVASEHASRNSKPDSSSRRTVAGVTALGLALLSPSYIYAADLPTGGQIVHGAGQISTPTANQMVIDQSSNKLAIDWQSFDIAAGNKVSFNQPSSQSIALNRVLGADGSKIMGQLDANGRVFLVNPSGVLFGAGAQVNVGGLVASTLDLSVEDFAAGNYQFKGNSTNNTVINQGSLKASDGGSIALLGGSVSNEGVIVANQGSVALAAGNKVTLDFAGDGLLNVQVDESMVDALVENKQLIKADGGQVLLTADAGEALLRTVVNNTGVIEAHTLGEKNGKIVLLGGFDGGTTQVAGTLDASAPDSGNGGFIETSGAYVKIANSAKVTTKSTAGKSGTWLIDPNNFTIAGSDGDMTGAAVSNALNSNANVTIETATMGSLAGSGYIHVDDAVSWDSNSTLTLSADRDININADISATNSGKIALEFGQDSISADNNADYFLNNNTKINLSAGENFSTKLGSDGDTLQYTVITELGKENSTITTDLQGIKNAWWVNYALGADIDASASQDWVGGFKPIGTLDRKFNGMFDGLGHSISNLTINRPNEDTVGLFGAIYDNTRLQNVALLNANITGYQYVGSLVGFSWGSIRNSYSTGAVTGELSVGGLIGAGSSISDRGRSNISDVYSSASVSGGYNVGGLAGTGSNIDNSYATGNVTGSGNFIGGLVGGRYSGTINNSYATGNVTGASSNVGGLVGNSSDGRASMINNSYATGTVTGEYMVGGLVGGSYSGISNSYATGDVIGIGRGEDIGGLIGRYDSRALNNSYATGKVVGKSVVGGLIGRSNYAEINNSYAKGKVEGIDYIGGLIGYSNDVAISYTYSTGDVEGKTNIGGLIGNSLYSESHKDSFYATTNKDGLSINNSGDFTSGYTGNTSGTGKTFEELLNLSTFKDAGWSLDNSGGTDNVWRIYDSYTTPLLREFLTNIVVEFEGLDKIYDGSKSGNLNYTSSLSNPEFLGHAFYRTKSASVGTYSTSKNTLAHGLYSDQQGYDITGDFSVIINKAAATVIVDNSSTVYNGQQQAAGFTVSGLVNGETTSVLTNIKVISRGKNVGTHKMIASGEDGNYDLSFIDGSLTINKAAATVTANSTTTIYNGQQQSVDGFTVSGLINGESESVLTRVTTSGGSGINAGTYQLIASGEDGNYALSFIDGTLTINKAAATVTVNDVSKVYDGQTFSGGNGVTYNGFVNNEDASVLSGHLDYGGDAQGAINTGTYNLNAYGLTARNYTLKFIDGTLTIEEQPSYQDVPPSYQDVLTSLQNDKQKLQDGIVIPASSETNNELEHQPYFVIDSGIRMPEGI